MTLVDRDARRRIVEDLDATLVVEAAAGTGKTTALVRRIVALVASGRATLDRIVAVTFTEKAAGEMKLRLRAGIEEERAQAPPEVAERLEAALRGLEAARIATIHSLCHDLLRERPVEARVDPLFEVAPEPEARELFDEAFERWFQGALADPPEGVRRVLRRRARDPEWRPRNLLLRAAWDLAERRDFPTLWRRDAFDREGALDFVVARLEELGALAGRAERPEKKDKLVKNLREVQRFTDDLRHKESVVPRDHDGLEARLRSLSRAYSWSWRGWGSQFGGGLSRDDVLELRDAVKAELDDAVARCDADLAPCLQRELAPVVEAYTELKERAGRLDFLDLVLRARDMLQESRAVREELQERFTHVLVDEFQDTDPLQADVVLLLSADDPAAERPEDVRVRPGKLFLVGDPKQSIYRFRRADVRLYERIKQRLVAEGAELLRLETSFRGDPRLQHLVNAAFAPRMDGRGQASYVPLAPARPHDPSRPSVVVLPVPRPYTTWPSGFGMVTKRAVDGSLPDAVAAWVSWLLNESGWKVTASGSREPVPVEARHVCLLFRRFQSWRDSVTAPFTRALEARGLPHVLVGGRTFHDREEVLAVRNALTAIEWPDDELAVFATLKGPLFSVGDDALLAWRTRRGRLHPLHTPAEDATDEESSEVAPALELLGALHRRRNRRPVAETLTDLLEAVRAHAGFALWDAGEQVLANVLKVVELARRFEARGATSFRAFVEQLAEQAERGEGSEAAVVEEGTEGVRVMTVHKAKGLEFPVVVLCDVTAGATPRNPTRFVDEDARAWYAPLAGSVPAELLERSDEVLELERQESDRILYVAATRARDVLVVPAVGDEPLDAGDWWTAPLHAALFPPVPARGEGAPAAGCPEFGTDSVLERPARRKGTGPGVAPGGHVIGEVEAVWWDPGVLVLGAPRRKGLRHWVLLVDDEDGGLAAAGVRRHAGWAGARAARLADGGRPSTDVRSPSGEEEAPETAPVRWEDTGTDRRARAGGRRFGTLVHAALADVDLDADAAAVDAVIGFHGRLLGATAAERDAAAEALRATLAHPLLDAARRSGDLRREEPLALQTGVGAFVEGSVDLAWRDDAAGRWTVVEVKTTPDAAESRARYEAQLAWYLRAVAAATGEPADGVILLV